MVALKYKVITSKSQYRNYCNALEKLTNIKTRTSGENDEIALLTLLIEKWDNEHNTFQDMDPVQLLHSLMVDHQLKSKDIANILGVSKGYVSDILQSKKGLSKTVIRKLASYFSLSQDAFNRV